MDDGKMGNRRLKLKGKMVLPNASQLDGRRIYWYFYLNEYIIT